jgi:2-polyprenyl-3-methyl-5-hydroxy-6-metoxy-1,4-benzoquinol methylase
VSYEQSRVDDFWTGYQPGFRASSASRGTREFFAEVEARRYAVEPHILEVCHFADWSGRSVLDAGCGIGIDGVRFASQGADYTGIDLSPSAIGLAQKRFELDGVKGRFIQAPVTDMPLESETFDFVFSHGVIHHIHDTQAAVDEFFRVLKPGGRVMVMVYHRHSINYFVTIMLLRRGLIGVLAIPGGIRAVGRLTGEDQSVLRGHRALLREHGLRYIRNRDLFLSNNTDGPGNALSKAYTRGELAELFRRFEDIRFTIRYLNLRSYPWGENLARTRLARRLERLIGWHLYIDARKPQSA